MLLKRQKMRTKNLGETDSLKNNNLEKCIEFINEKVAVKQNE